MNWWKKNEKKKCSEYYYISFSPEYYTSGRSEAHSTGAGEMQNNSDEARLVLFEYTLQSYIWMCKNVRFSYFSNDFEEGEGTTGHASPD